jgi:hypothetical protein
LGRGCLELGEALEGHDETVVHDVRAVAGRSGCAWWGDFAVSKAAEMPRRYLREPSAGGRQIVQA